MLSCAARDPMAVYTPLSADQLADVLRRYGLPPPERTLPEPKGSVNTNYHLWSGGRRWFLRLNEGKTAEDVGELVGGEGGVERHRRCRRREHARPLSPPSTPSAARRGAAGGPPDAPG